MKSATPKKFVFLLGCQRSGTTWLTNVFDASRDVLTFVEPFAPTYGIVPGFPGVFDSFDVHDNEWKRWLEEEFCERIMHRKYLLLRRSLQRPFWFKFELGFARLFHRHSPRPFQQRIRQFELLNLNRLRHDSPDYWKKVEPSHWVVKELRLAGKLPLIISAFPEAYFVVIVRHPCATVHSILNWFEKGHLMELRGDLKHFVDKIESQAVGSNYFGELRRCRSGGLAHTTALYWRICYETLWRHLAYHDRTLWVIYEDMATSPDSVSSELSRFLCISNPEDMIRYVQYSSRTKSLESETDPLNTVRESQKHYLAWTDRISNETRNAVLEICQESFLLPHFDRYYSATNGSQ